MDLKFLIFPSLLAYHQQVEDNLNKVIQDQALSGYHHPDETTHHLDSHFQHHYQNQAHRLENIHQYQPISLEDCPFLK